MRKMQLMKFGSAMCASVLIGLALAASTSAAGSAPDLRVVSFVDPPQIAIRESQFSTALTVRNTGGARARSTRAGLFLSKNTKRDARDTLLAKVPVRTLSPGAKTTRQARVTVPKQAAGEYFLLFCVDVDRRVREVSERNNCVASAYTALVRD